MALNSRDIVTLERELKDKVHPRVFEVLIKFNEDLHALRQQIMSLAQLFDQLINNQIVLASATKTIHQHLPHLRKMREMGMEVGSDPTVTGEVDDDERK